MLLHPVLLLLSLFLLYERCHGADESVIMMKIERQALGNIPVLGQLYSAHSDQLLHGFSFWYHEEIEANKIKTWHPWQETKINRDQSQDVDLNLLRVDASLEASFKAGMVKIAGSASFLQRDQTTAKSSSVTFSYRSRSRTESISPSLTQNRPIDVCNKDNPVNRLDKNSVPTHVVSAISYGGDVHFVYTEEVDDKEDLMDIYGALSITIKLGLVNINGKASVNYTTKENDLKNKLKIEMYSDFIIDKQPTSFNDTIAIYETVAQNFGSKESMYEMSVPMSMQLIPIIAFCPEGGLAAEISASFLKVATNIRLTLKGALKEIEKLLATIAAKRNVKVREILLDFQMDVTNYTLNYESELKKNIIDARNPKSDVDQSAIDELVKEHKNSKYNYDKYLYPYLTERTRQVNAINMFYELTLNQNEPQIAEYQKAEVPRAILTEPILFLLTLNILPNFTTESYSSFVNSNGDNSKNVWYNDKTKVGQIGQLWRDFLGFFSFNEYKVGFEFFVETLEENIDSGLMGVSLYENGMEMEIKKEDFDKLVQTGPEPIVKRDLNTNSINVEVAAPNNNDDENPFKINNIEIQITQSTVDASNLYPSKMERIEQSLDVCSNGECVMNIKDIQPVFSYNISVAYNSKFGLGKPSKVTKLNGIFDEMMKVPGCIMENNIKLDEITSRDVSTVVECAEGSSGYYWSFNIGSNKCYDQVPGKNAMSPTVGWATGTASCTLPPTPPPPTTITTDPIGCRNPDSAGINWHDYRGKQDKTKSGITCQRWDSQSPQTHAQAEPTITEYGLEENYCRNPNGNTAEPWCYTTDPDTRLEVCDIPMCA